MLAEFKGLFRCAADLRVHGTQEWLMPHDHDGFVRILSRHPTNCRMCAAIDVPNTHSLDRPHGQELRRLNGSGDRRGDDPDWTGQTELGAQLVARRNRLQTTARGKVPDAVASPVVSKQHLTQRHCFGVSKQNKHWASLAALEPAANDQMQG